MNDLVKVFEYEGRPLTVLTYKGRPAFIAKEVETRMGYAPKGINDLARGEWAEEIVYGDDFVVVSGKELAELKQVLQQAGGYPTSRARSMMLLFESGINAIALLSRKPEARKLRKFLASNVIPQLIRDGKYDPDRKVNELGQMVSVNSGTGLALEEVESQVMLMDAETRRYEAETKRMAVEATAKNADTKRIESDRRHLRGQSQALKYAAKARFALKFIDSAQYHAQMLKAAEIVTGGQIGTKNKSEDGGKLTTPTELARTLKVSPAMIGRLVTKAGKALNVKNIRGNDAYVVPRTHRVEFSDGSSLHPDGYVMKQLLVDAIVALETKQTKLF